MSFCQPSCQTNVVHFPSLVDAFCVSCLTSKARQLAASPIYLLFLALGLRGCVMAIARREYLVLSRSWLPRIQIAPSATHQSHLPYTHRPPCFKDASAWRAGLNGYFVPSFPKPSVLLY